MANGHRVPGGFGVRRPPDRSVRMQPGEAMLDPGMRAQAGQFTDVTSPGYAAQAAAQAERGGAMEFGTSVEAEGDAGRDALIMEIVGAVLAMMTGAGAARTPGGGAGGYIPSAGAKFHGMTGRPINAGVSRINPAQSHRIPGTGPAPPGGPVRGVPRPRQNVRGRRPTRGQEDLPLGDRTGRGMRSDYLEAGRRWLPRVRNTLRNPPRR
jgi:hypothetical protein